MQFQLFWILSLVLIQQSFPGAESRRVQILENLVNSGNVDSGKDTLKESSLARDSLDGDSNSDKQGRSLIDAAGSLRVSDVLLQEKVRKMESIPIDEGISEMPEPRPAFSFLGQLQGFMAQVVNLLGSTTAVLTGQRRQKGLEDDEGIDENLIQPSINYREELRTTVGAVLGKEECLQQAACRAGKYLKNVKGKEIILVILEKLSPENWIETVQVVKESAIRKARCQYKCFDP